MNNPPLETLETSKIIQRSLEEHSIAILPPMDVHQSLELVKSLDWQVKVTMLDPWYNKGVGGVRTDYRAYILDILKLASTVSGHSFLWGFPEIIAQFIECLPEPLKLEAWLTWYFKNSPSVIRGWRSSQMTCLHLKHPAAKLYPEHFLNAAQKEKLVQGKLRYMPGPTTVIEEPYDEFPLDVIQESLLVGFVGKKEQTGHPAQKPIAVFKRLYLMTTKPDDLVIDPMCGSGTTGMAARSLGIKAILSDEKEDFIQIAENRLGVKRVNLPPHIA